MVAVVGLTAALVNTTPPQSASGGVQSGHGRARLGFGGTSSSTLPAPALNSIHLYLLDEGGPLLRGAASVELDLSLPSAEIGPLVRQPVLAGPGHYQLDGDELSVAGTWTIQVKALVDKFTEQTATAQVDVAP